MQFGLFTLFDYYPDRQNEARYYRDTLELMIYAEQLGYDSVWAGEEHFYSFGICPSPQIFLTAVAQATSRLRLGTALSVLPLENPLRKAEDFAMLDILSEGRVDLRSREGRLPQAFRGLQGALVGEPGTVRGSSGDYPAGLESGQRGVQWAVLAVS